MLCNLNLRLSGLSWGCICQSWDIPPGLFSGTQIMGQLWEDVARSVNWYQNLALKTLESASTAVSPCNYCHHDGWYWQLHPVQIQLQHPELPPGRDAYGKPCPACEPIFWLHAAPSSRSPCHSTTLSAAKVHPTRLIAWQQINRFVTAIAWWLVQLDTCTWHSWHKES